MFLNILSGQVAINDTILLCTSRILRFLTTNQLSDIFSRQSFDESVSLFRHELTVAAEEDILVTAIGIGKKEGNTLGAGFLSKMVTKAKETLVKPETTQPVSPAISVSTSPTTSSTQKNISETHKPEDYTDDYDQENYE